MGVEEHRAELVVEPPLDVLAPCPQLLREVSGGAAASSARSPRSVAYLLDLTALHRDARDAGEINTDQVALDLVNQARSAERSRPGRGHRSDSSFTAERGEPAYTPSHPDGRVCAPKARTVQEWDS